MRWSYKTVHYDLVKEGLLGNSFLDEAEVEKSLNEFGKAGWELVSIMETQDGVIAIFKQPFDDLNLSKGYLKKVSKIQEEDDEPEEDDMDEPILVDDEDLITEEDFIQEVFIEEKEEKKKIKKDKDDGLQSIRIE